MQPRMIMHPYRPDLEGQDISTFADQHMDVLESPVDCAKKLGLLLLGSIYN